MDWSREFPGLRQGTYLNSCSHGLLPRRTRAAIEAHLDAWEARPDWGEHVAAIERARRAFARLIGAHEDEVSVQANASTGIAAVMNALRPGARDELVTLDIDFPTGPFLAERQKTRGFRHTHLRAGLVRPDEWARHLSERTALANVPFVSSFTGYRLDVRSFARRAHEKGVPLLVDAFQAVGTFPIDVKADDVDFLVSGVYKWLLAPAGLAFLYVKREHHGLLPTTSGWMGAQEPYSFDPLGPLASRASRFDQGGPSVVGCHAFAASAALIEEVGLAAIERTNAALVARIVEKARERKWEVLTPEAPEERGSIVTFRPARGGQAGPQSGGVRVPDLERALAACAREDVIINPRLGGVRVSPHFYNSAADVDRLFEVLDAA